MINEYSSPKRDTVSRIRSGGDVDRRKKQLDVKSLEIIARTSRRILFVRESKRFSLSLSFYLYPSFIFLLSDYV